jgi:hypothetical protein
VDALERAIIKARSLLALLRDVRGSRDHGTDDDSIRHGSSLWSLSDRHSRKEIASYLLYLAVMQRVAADRGIVGDQLAKLEMLGSHAEGTANPISMSLRDAHIRLIHAKNATFMARDSSGASKPGIHPMVGAMLGTGLSPILQLLGTHNGREWNASLDLYFYLEFCTRSTKIIREYQSDNQKRFDDVISGSLANGNTFSP